MTIASSISNFDIKAKSFIFRYRRISCVVHFKTNKFPDNIWKLDFFGYQPDGSTRTASISIKKKVDLYFVLKHMFKLCLSLDSMWNGRARWRVPCPKDLQMIANKIEEQWVAKNELAIKY